jgi:acyl dehydratase
VLSAYRVKARNTSSQSENRIHDDAEARRWGFAGALVPGVTVYGYLTRPVVAALGEAWLDAGGASVRFLRPVLDGEEVLVRPDGDAGGGAWTLRVLDAGGQERAVAEVRRQAGGPPVDPGTYPAVPPPAERPAGSRDELAVGRVLGTAEATYDEREAAEFLDGQADTLALYRGPGARVHPAFYLRLANRVLTGTVRVSPWIHLASRVRHLGPARLGERLRARGRIAAAYERKGRELVEMDVLVLAGPPPRPVAEIRHTAIWRLGPPA